MLDCWLSVEAKMLEQIVESVLLYIKVCDYISIKLSTYVQFQIFQLSNIVPKELGVVHFSVFFTTMFC